MSYIFGSIKPYFRCLLRREFTTDGQRHHGEFVPVIAHAVTCKTGNSLWFYVSCLDPLGGALWHVPIQALVDKPCPMPEDMSKELQRPRSQCSLDFTLIEYCAQSIEQYGRRLAPLPNQACKSGRGGADR
jgi:hypothetical protein